MKVTLKPVDADDGWAIELEVEKETTIAQFKVKVAALPESPTFTKTSRILFKGTAGPMYSLQDNEKVKKTMLFADPNAVKKPPAQTPAPAPRAAQPKAVPKAEPKAAAPKAVAPKVAAAKPAAQPDPPQHQPRPMAPPRPAQSPGERAHTFPFFDDMSQMQRERVCRRLQAQWPRGARPNTPSWRTASQAADMARAMASLISPDDPCLVSCIAHAFGNSSDIMAVGVTGLMHAHEVIYYTAAEVVRRFRPVQQRFGFAATVAGFVEMDKAIRAHLDNSDVMESAARVWCHLCFGGRQRRTEPLAPAANAVFAGIQMPTVQLLAQPVSFLHHLALPPMERRWRSIPRTIAVVEAALQMVLQMRPGRRKATNKRVMWILGATNEVEGSLALYEYFEDAAALVNGEPMNIHLIGDGLAVTWPSLQGEARAVKLHAHSWSDLHTGGLPDPEFVFIFNSGIGTLDPDIIRQWLPRLADLLVYPGEHKPVIVSTSRCVAEAHGEEKLFNTLQAVPFMPKMSRTGSFHMRNIYSGMAGDPYIDYDDNGWFAAVCGTLMSKEDLLPLAMRPDDVCKFAQELQASHPSDWVEAAKAPFVDGLEGDETSPKAGAEGTSKKKDPAVFWGILDLKYEPSRPVQDRVKVLETGDGRSSRFSGYGAAILENFKQENKLEDTLRRAVLVENKKLTHDIILDTGYAHIRPQQEFYPKEYSSDLARRIRKDLRLEKDSDICVLKLPNRTRGAGVIPIVCSELDEALKLLLRPPSDIVAWLRERDKMWVRKVSWGCFEEQVRHWWSNESPCFLVEEFCCSLPTFKEIDDGSVRPFDGTMRVGFSLHREPEQKLPPGWVNSDNGPLFVGTEDQDGPIDPQDQSKFLDRSPENRPLYVLFPSGSDVLRLQWLGGYWKLPVEDVNSPDLRGRVVSVAKRGTAPVPAWQLHEVYAALGDCVSLTFNTKDISHSSLLKRYSADPEWGAFVVGRLACSMRIRDRNKSGRILAVAQQIVQNIEGVPRNLVASYIERNQGVMEALFSRWKEAEAIFRKSLNVMPANATSRFLVGLCQLEQGQTMQSISMMEDSLQLDPDFKAPYVNLGLAWIRAGDYLRAVEVCEAGEKRHPNTPWALYNLGVARYALCALAEQGLESGTREDMRGPAVEALEFARDNVGKDGPWNDQDDKLVECLKDSSRPLPIRSSYDGWRFVNWRP